MKTLRLTSWQRIAATLFCAAVLLSCGGGGSSQPPPAAPVILQQPTSTSAKAGGTATFSVGASDSSSVSYQWLRNGVNIAGETKARLELSPVWLLESGAAFSVVVANAAGSVSSNQATLTATSPALTIIAGVQVTPGNFPVDYVDATGSNARFNGVGSIAVDDDGNVYAIAALSIRKVTPEGVVTTFAGSRNRDGWVDGNGANARFGFLGDLMFDRSRRVLLVTDGVGSTSLVREITLAGDVTTRSSTPAPEGIIKFGADGTVYYSGGNVRLPAQIDIEQSAVYRSLATGPAQLLAGDPDVREFKDGVPGQARFRHITALAADGNGNVYVADDHSIRRISADGSVTTVAGSSTTTGTPVDGVGAAADFSSIQGLYVERSGSLLFTDRNLVRRVTPAGRVTTIANSSTQNFGLRLAFDGTGMLYASGPFWVGRFEPIAPGLADPR